MKKKQNQNANKRNAEDSEVAELDDDFLNDKVNTMNRRIKGYDDGDPKKKPKQ